jgi:hypothetical protein
MKTTFGKTLKHTPVNPDMNVGIGQPVLRSPDSIGTEGGRDSRLLGNVGTKS